MGLVCLISLFQVSLTVTGKTEYTSLVGQSVTLSCSADGRPEPTITWSKIGSALPSVDGGDLLLSSVKLADSGTYTCIASNDFESAILFANLTVQSNQPLG